MQTAIMIEGQNGLDWKHWQRIAVMVEDLGFSGLFRSDHFTNSSPPDLDSLELWTSLTWLATHTNQIEFGPLVSPISFRHPALTARMAAAVDDLSSGRLILGLGAGWQEREHHLYGFDLLDMNERFVRFEEGLQVISSLLQSQQTVEFEGKYFQLREAQLLPKPSRLGGPPILIGGNGERRTLPLVARFASEWNALFLTPDEFRRLNTTLDKLLEEENRRPDSVKRSMMTGCVVGKSTDDVINKVQSRSQGKTCVDDLRKRGLIVGTVEEIRTQLSVLEDVGLQRVMLQWLDLDDLDGLRLLASGIIR